MCIITARLKHDACKQHLRTRNNQWPLFLAVQNDSAAFRPRHTVEASSLFLARINKYSIHSSPRQHLNMQPVCSAHSLRHYSIKWVISGGATHQHQHTIGAAAPVPWMLCVLLIYVFKGGVVATCANNCKADILRTSSLLSKLLSKKYLDLINDFKGRKNNFGANRNIGAMRIFPPYWR